MSATIGGLSKLAVSEQHEENAWRTPGWLVERIRELLGTIELDPCTDPDNPTKAARFYTSDNDGILMPWDAATIYCNPPYGKTIRHWLAKCALAAATGSKVVALIPCRTDPPYFHDAINAAGEALFFRGRIKFEDRGGALLWNAPFPSVLLGFNVSLASLSDLGTIMITRKVA